MGNPNHLPLRTKLGFLLGWVFFALAFLFAAAEATLARDGFFMSTNELLVALSPGKWIAFKARYDSAILQFLLNSLLLLPGWLLAGIPAGVLIWTCRPHREDMDPELYNSLTTYDRLAEMAREEGALDDDPTFQDYDPADYESDLQRDDVRSARDYMKDWNTPAAQHEETPPPPMGPEERMDDARAKLSIPFDKLS